MLMRNYGATVVCGGDREARARDLVDRGDCFPSTVLCPRSGIANPFGVEGFKTIALEIVHELNSVPDRVYVPTGSGDGIYGIWKGFRELKNSGLIATVPQMIACQAEGANSAVRAFRKGALRAELLHSVETNALSIAERITGDHALRAVYESNGCAIAVSDEQIRKAARFAAMNGLAIEMSSAAALAGIMEAQEPDTEETWVAIATGAAVKWPSENLAD